MGIKVIMHVLCEEGRTYDGPVTVLIGISPVICQASYVHNKGTGFSCGMLHLFFTGIILHLAEFRETQPITV